MATTLNATLAGSRDRQLEELMQTCGLRVTVSKLEELATLAQPAATQPALVIVDMRDRPALPPTIGMLRRQHPATGVVIVAASLEPALMLEAMRAGVTEFLTAPVSARTSRQPSRESRRPTLHGTSGEVFAFLGAKGGVGTTTVATNVATALAQIDERIDAPDRPAPGVRRRGCLPRDRAAVLGHRRARERASPRQGVPGGLVGHAKGGLSLAGVLGSGQRDACRLQRVCGR